jgi:hypothetical protein
MQRKNVADWYQNKHNGANISQQEIERKWRVHLWEKEQMDLAESIAIRDAMNAAYSSGGGGPKGPETTPEVELVTELGQVLQTENGQDLILT